VEGGGAEERQVREHALVAEQRVVGVDRAEQLHRHHRAEQQERPALVLVGLQPPDEAAEREVGQADREGGDEDRQRQGLGGELPGHREQRHGAARAVGFLDLIERRHARPQVLPAAVAEPVVDRGAVDGEHAVAGVHPRAPHRVGDPRHHDDAARTRGLERRHVIAPGEHLARHREHQG
jgi:hypothetical protein